MQCRLHLCKTPTYIDTVSILSDFTIRPESGNSNQVTTSRTGQIFSHWNYPNRNYPTNIDSSIQLINLQRGQQVTISFSGFEIFYNRRLPGCNDDYLEIFGLQSASIRYCNDESHRPRLNTNIQLTSGSSAIKFRFITNKVLWTRSKGFRFSFAGK